MDIDQTLTPIFPSSPKTISPHSPLNIPRLHPLPIRPSLAIFSIYSPHRHPHRQSNRPPPRARNDAPYSRPVRPPLERDTRSAGPSRGSGPSGLAGRITGRGGTPRLNGNPRRAPEGTPALYRGLNPAEEAAESKRQASILSAKLRNEGMKIWLRSRVLNPGVMDMSVRLLV